MIFSIKIKIWDFIDIMEVWKKYIFYFLLNILLKKVYWLSRIMELVKDDESSIYDHDIGYFSLKLLIKKSLLLNSFSAVECTTIRGNSLSM